MAVNVPGLVIGLVVALFVLYAIYSGIVIVKEKEVMVIERFGRFDRVLTAGVHFLIPFVDRPKIYWYRYVVSNNLNQTVTHVNLTNTKISLQNEVIDFPKQGVITRDNALISLDAVLSFQILNAAAAKTMMYSVQNLPFVLGKLLQAHIRNVAAQLDVDQIIEDAGSLNVLTQLMNDTCVKWGVHINFVKIQRVDANTLTKDLAMAKNADLKNNKVIISAKSDKQTKVLDAEGQRDSMIKKAEGEAAQMLAEAQGEAEAILNAAKAESKKIGLIAPTIARAGEDAVKYMVTTKYVDQLGQALQKPGTTLHLVPNDTASVQVAQSLGLNTIAPSSVQQSR